MAIGGVVVGRGGLEERAADSLMESLVVIVGHVLRYDAPEMALTEEDEVAQALFLCGSNEAFRVWIALWASGRNLHALYALRFGDARWSQNGLEISGEERSSVVNES